jgi:hypothetical protein
MYSGYRVSFPEVKRPGRGVDHLPSSSARVKERVQLYLYSPSGPSWPVIGRALPLPYQFSKRFFIKLDKHRLYMTQKYVTYMFRYFVVTVTGILNIFWLLIVLEKNIELLGIAVSTI